jgi:hypothetical protein
MKNLCPVKWNLTKEQELELKENYEKLLINFLAFTKSSEMSALKISFEFDILFLLIYLYITFVLVGQLILIAAFESAVGFASDGLVLFLDPSLQFLHQFVLICVF